MLTKAEQTVAIDRIRSWPREERAFVARLRGTELECVLALVALLDARPEEKA